MGLALLAAALAGWSAEKPLAYTCQRNATAPTLDGAIAGDPGWANIPGATGYHRLGDDYTMAKQTTAYVTWDAENLWIGIVAEEPDIAQVKPTQRDNGDCWLDDGVEVFVQPEGRGPYQFVVTTAGARCAYQSYRGLEGWAAQTSHTDNAYSIELRVSFKLFEVTPQDGAVWHANYCRNIFTTDSGGDKFTTWAPLVSQFLEPEHFPVLRFSAEALSPADCEQAQAVLNAPYRAVLTKEIADLAASAKQYLPFLKQVADDPKYKQRAAPLLEGWDKVVQLQRHAAQAPLPEVRQSLSQSQRLREASHEFQYSVLIERLFED
jgi:hypothetical protein